MTQTVFSGTTGDVGLLNANFTELYAFFALLGSPTGSVNHRVDADYYFGFRPYGTLQYNFYVPAGTVDAAQMRIRRGTTDVMMFDAVGNILVSGQSALPSTGMVGTAFAKFASELSQLQFRANATAATGAQLFFNPNGQIGSINLSGSATAYNTSSDERLKENIVDAGDSGARIDAFRVRSFDWLRSGEHVEFGLVAQELHTVAPEAVTVGGDDENTDPWAIDPSKLVPLLVRELQLLRARVTALEAA